MTQDFTAQIKAYYQAITAGDSADHTEASYRTALHILLNHITHALHPNHQIIHEPTDRDGFGRPDFLIKSTNSGQFVVILKPKPSAVT